MANEVTIHVKAEDRASMAMGAIGKKVEVQAKRSFLKAGGHAGAAFAAGFIKTITLGQVGSGFAMAATKLAPQMAHLGGALGATLAAGLVVKLASTLSALLPGAIGGAALAGPLVYLWKTQEKAVDRLRKKAENFMKVISRPVKVPFLKSLEIVGDKLGEWGPKFAKAIKPLAKELPGFVKGALKGLENFAKEIGKEMPSITKGFRQWGKELPGIGKALGRMIARWIEDGPELVQGIKDAAKSMRKLADTVGDAGVAFRKFGKANSRFKDMIEEQRATVLRWRISLLRSILVVLDAWGLISPRARQMATTVRRALNVTQHELKETEGRARGAKHGVDALNFALRRIPRHVSSKITIWGVTKGDASAISTWKSQHGGRLFASGGNVGAAATGGMRGNQVLVGEHGPEIVDLPVGSHVNSNPDSRRMMAEGGRGGSGITININAPNYVGAPADLLRALVDAKRRGQLDVILR